MRRVLPVAELGLRIGLATGEGVLPGYDTQVMHQPAYSLFDLLKLAGRRRDRRRIPDRAAPADEHVQRAPPRRRRRAAAGAIRGYFRGAGGTVTMDVAPPPGVSAANAVAWANGRRVASTVAGGLVQFTLPTRPGVPADWALT